MAKQAMHNQEIYSDYSRHFLDLDQETVARNIRKLETRIERFRLRLDLLLIRRYAKGPDLLDFPVGTGRIHRNLLNEFNVFGYDICESYIARARDLNPEIAAHFAVNAFEQIDDPRQFDTILSFRVLTNVKDKPGAARNVFAITKPGGRWIFTFFPRGGAADLRHMRQWLAEAGFRLVAQQRYDVQASSGRLGPVVGRLWPYWRALVERGLVPFFAYRLSDALIPGAGTWLFVAERPA